MVELREITKDNLEAVLDLRVHEHQESFVSSTAYSLAQAYAYRDTAFPFAVYEDNTIVGFIMLGYYEARNQYTLWKFLIDKKYQNKGYGKEATRMVLDAMKADGKYNKVVLCYLEGNEAAKKLYEKFGFVETDRDEDEIIMELSF